MTEKQMVIEAIANVIQATWADGGIGKDSAANAILSLTYPSGSPMIGILAEKQEVPASICEGCSCYFKPEKQAIFPKRLRDAGFVQLAEEKK